MNQLSATLFQFNWLEDLPQGTKRTHWQDEKVSFLIENRIKSKCETILQICVYFQAKTGGANCLFIAHKKKEQWKIWLKLKFNL